MSDSTTSADVVCYGTNLVLARGPRRIGFEDFSIAKGDRFAILGSNGSGKSTLCLAIAGLMRAQAGQLVRSREYRKLSIGYLPQGGGLYPHLTVGDNIAFFRRLFTSDHAFDPRLFPVLWTLGLETVLEVEARSLSGGFFRLAAIACILCLGADALVLDEPMSGLDDGHRDAVRSAIGSVATTLKFLVATGHRRKDVDFCNRTMVIGDRQ
jgi:ABC-type multidrug transport system ATPase subunit